MPPRHRLDDVLDILVVEDQHGGADGGGAFPGHPVRIFGPGQPGAGFGRDPQRGDLGFDHLFGEEVLLHKGA
jgi:hypothetical protein